MHLFESDSRQLYPLLYPDGKLHYVRSVDAEEDVQDFRLLCPGLVSLQVIMPSVF